MDDDFFAVLDVDAGREACGALGGSAHSHTVEAIDVGGAWIGGDGRYAIILFVGEITRILGSAVDVCKFHSDV